MISIIICSRKKSIDTNLSDNIKNTVGCEYELIVIDNSENKYSIFEAYNLGIEKSTGEYLCFMHDDILIHTIGWGGIIKKIFKKNKNIGLLGIAGAKVKSRMPSAWWDCSDDFKRMRLLQHFGNKDIKDWEIGWENTTIEEVVTIDGVFMAARKIERIQFNEDFEGFHNYDLNICFEYLKNKFKIVVTKEIFIEHFSIGTINADWVKSTKKIHSFYRGILPIQTISIVNADELKKIEVSNAIRFIEQSLTFGLRREAFLTWCSLFYLKPIFKYHPKFLGRFFFKIQNNKKL
jgi:hypothetical protein